MLHSTNRIITFSFVFLEPLSPTCSLLLVKHVSQCLAAVWLCSHQVVVVVCWPTAQTGAGRTFAMLWRLLSKSSQGESANYVYVFTNTYRSFKKTTNTTEVCVLAQQMLLRVYETAQIFQDVVTILVEKPSSNDVGTNHPCSISGWFHRFFQVFLKWRRGSAPRPAPASTEGLKADCALRHCRSESRVLCWYTTVI